MKDWIKRIFGEKGENTKRPANWDLTIADLMNEMTEGKRKSLGHPELTWAREYEKSRIPKNYRFPQQGDLYESLIDQEIEFLTSWTAPFTGSGKATLLKGERIWIDSAPIDKNPIGAYALPVDYVILEARMVSEQDRTAPNYDGFHFSFSTVDLNEKFGLIETGFKKEKYI